jgi:CheY-like chemotaxis protein
MIVEDIWLIANDLKESLGKLGYTVTAIVSSGEDAVKKAGEEMPDLILMDIVLSGRMDGIEAAEKIRSATDIPVIYLTAYSDETKLGRAKVTEPFGYLIKPVNDRELHTTIEMALYRNKMEHERKNLLKDIDEASRTIRTLQGLLPICSHCKKIRDDKGYWEQIETYFSEHTGAQFSHSVCPECSKKFHTENRKD